MVDQQGAFAAADLGASSGRVILGRLSNGRFTLEETARFENGPVDGADGALHWDADRLDREIRAGFEEALRRTGGALDSVGIDTWGVDYGRLDAGGALLEQPFHYRDGRTGGVPARVFERIPAARLYAETGLQVQEFNTIYQLVAQAGDPGWEATETLLLMPDLLNFLLTGRRVAEMTVASTSGLLDVAGRRWSPTVCAALADGWGLPLPRVLPELLEPGRILATTAPGVLSREVPVALVGSHDTASAVVAVPSVERDVAYISSGTWSLVGLELDAPVVSAASEAANFTNELGVDGTVRYLKNVMGLWVLMECRREWQAEGRLYSWGDLIALAGAEPPLRCVLDMNDGRLLPPGGMRARLRSMASETGQQLPDEPGAIVRCILDSLALAYRQAIRHACALAGRDVRAVNIVGGGSQNALLCQLTAEATGLPVVAGPAEGTALGNLLVQARACGVLGGDLADLRRVAIASSDLTTYSPGALDIPAERWDAAVRSHLS